MMALCAVFMILPDTRAGKPLLDTPRVKSPWFAPGVKSGGKPWITLFSEDFESGALPPGWTVSDGNSDGYTWAVIPAVGWHSDAMPPSPGGYIVAYDDDAVGSNPSTEEELFSPPVAISGYDTLCLIYGFGYQNYIGYDTFAVKVRVHDGSSWGPWQTLAIYDTDMGSDNWDTLDLSSLMPGESLQVDFAWWDHASTHYDWYVALDNVSVEYFRPVNHNITARSIISPGQTARDGEAVSPTARMVNTGYQDINADFDVVFTIQDTIQVVYADTQTVTGGLAAGDSVDVVFTTWFAGPLGGPYLARAFSTYPDSVPDDDTCSRTFGVIPDSIPTLLSVPYSTNVPDLDGVLSPGEWDDAVQWDASDYLASDGYTNYVGECIVHAKHDGSRLYLAYDVPGDTNMSDHSQAGFCLDDDASGKWPPSDTTEGLNAAGTDNGWRCAWMREDFSSGGWYPSGLSDYAFSIASGHVSAEVAIQLTSSDSGPQFLGAEPYPSGDTVGVHIYYYDAAEPGNIIAYWPQDLPRFYDPAGYGRLYLEPSQSVSGEGPGPDFGLRVPGLVQDMARIRVSLPHEGDLTLSVYDPAGRLILCLWDGPLARGSHEFTARLPRAGVFFVVARAGAWSATRKTLLVGQ